MVSPRVDEEAVEIFSQAFELQGQFLDVRVPFLSIDEKRPVELVQGVVDLILLFESGKLVRFVILGMYSKSKGNSQGLVERIYTLSTSNTSWRRASDAVWNTKKSFGFGMVWLSDPSYCVPGQSDYRRNIRAPSHDGPFARCKSGTRSLTGSEFGGGRSLIGRSLAL